jgi:chemotaxis methyl-accepting protein methylase
MFGLFKSEDEKIFESFQKQINKTDLLENNALQIAIIDRVHTHYQNSLIQVKEKNIMKQSYILGRKHFILRKNVMHYMQKKLRKSLRFACL